MMLIIEMSLKMNRSSWSTMEQKDWNKPKNMLPVGDITTVRGEQKGINYIPNYVF